LAAREKPGFPAGITGRGDENELRRILNSRIWQIFCLPAKINFVKSMLG
jgi:hypothetical protein